MIIEVIYLSTEIDLLDARLHELEDIVDYHIIVEYPFNYSGSPCRMYYDENKERFKKFEHKIIHIVDSNTYGGVKGIGLLAERQNSQTLMDAITKFSDNDFVVTCDGDAFVRKQAFDNIDLTKHTIFRMEWCSYWLNAYCPNVVYDWAFGAPVHIYKKSGGSGKLSHTVSLDKQLINESGWHWSKLGVSKK